jgi:hypothetical protein
METKLFVETHPMIPRKKICAICLPSHAVSSVTHQGQGQRASKGLPSWKCPRRPKQSKPSRCSMDLV